MKSLTLNYTDAATYYVARSAQFLLFLTAEFHNLSVCTQYNNVVLYVLFFFRNLPFFIKIYGVFHATKNPQHEK